ncbi:hypothetical protein ACOI1C_19435 [Bacillus sp. DJP31]|uniref:hypothetical protein n=1 Tax=Bacillus sp. DJP31 TaxID=3409789 RepID=UPI003BB724EC
MGFLKGLGSFVGAVAGEVVGGAVKFTGEVTGSKFIEEIGDGVKNASYFAGDKLGEAASGVWDIGTSIVTQDEQKLDRGLGDLGRAVGDTAKAAGHTVVNIVENGANVVTGVIDGDNERLKSGAKGLLMAGAVGVLSFGVIDIVDGTDGVSADSGNNMAEGNTESSNVHQVAAHQPSVEAPANENVNHVDNPNSHHVEPHWRTLPNGTTIWVDGDGDSSVNTNGGWVQGNPDYRVKG